KGSIKTTESFKVGRRHVMGAFKGAISDVRVYERILSGEEVRALAGHHPALAILRVPAEKRTAQQKADLTSYHRSQDFLFNFLRAGIEEAKNDLARAGSGKTMVLEERPHPRDNFLMRRGDYRQKG